MPGKYRKQNVRQKTCEIKRPLENTGNKNYNTQKIQEIKLQLTENTGNKTKAHRKYRKENNETENT